MAHIPPTLSLTGRTVLVTGSNAGIGLEVGRQLLLQKASTLIMAVRSISKGESARQQLLSDPAVSALAPTIKIYDLDLSSFRSVISFAEKVTAEESRLDVVVFNAGLNIMSWTESPDGNEMMYQVNYLSNALLSLLLLPKLRQTAKAHNIPARLTFVSSEMHKRTEWDKAPQPPSILSYVNSKSTYKGLQRYPCTKLLLTQWTRELAAHVPAHEVVINSVCPGMVQATGLDRNLPFWMKPIVAVLRGMVGKSVEAGAKHLVYAAIAAPAEEQGAFWSNDKVTKYAFPESEKGMLMQRALWEETREECKKIAPPTANVV